MNRLYRILLSVIIVLLVVGYAWRAVQIAENDNTDRFSADQGAYMNYTQDVWEHGFFAQGDRARMPLYPWVQSLFYDPDLGDEELFRRGKFVNIGLSLLLLAAVAAIVKRRLPWLTIGGLLLAIAFTVFLFKAPNYQPELLFYTLTLAAFLLLAHVLRQPDWRWAVLAGLVAALAQYAKAAALPMVVLFGFWGCISAMAALAGSREASVSEEKHLEWGQAARRLLPVLLTLCVFLGALAPYLIQSKRIYGRYWYNVSVTFYMWYDSWAEAKQGTRAHGDREGWPDMPADEIPSARKYLAEHTPWQITERLASGLVHLESKARHLRGYYRYVVVYGMAVLVLLGWHRRRAWVFLRQRAVLVLFGASYIVLSILLYAWYVPISGDNRFILALFMPLVVSAALVLHAPALAPPIVVWRRHRLDPLVLFDGALLLLAGVNALVVLAPIFLLSQGAN